MIALTSIMLNRLRTVLKRVAARLPHHWQQQLKRRYFARQIRRGVFVTSEPEFDMLHQLVCLGDWVIDVGAHTGHYTLRLSRLVGPMGRVIAFEPIPETFELLASNVRLSPHANVTLLNAAASDETSLEGMSVPHSSDSGLRDLYSARLRSGKGGISVLCLSVDALDLPQRITLVKIDAEGHELAVLRGMRQLMQRDQPALIVEDTNTRQVAVYLESLGYLASKVRGSANRVYRVPSRSMVLVG